MQALLCMWPALRSVHVASTKTAAWGCIAIARSFCSAARARSKVLFLGTPLVAAHVLRELVKASTQKDAAFEVCGVVTKASASASSLADAISSEQSGNAQVQHAAWQLGFGSDQILTPASPKQPEFLSAVAQMAPDLCVTAAYGGLLPQAFLDLPRLGTINVHPSLLPKYRGAAPVQRALEAGERETGVSLVYTVLQCDAGPILDQVRVPLNDGDEQAPELMARLFRMGTSMLLARMPDILSGRGLAMARPQDHAFATKAPKVSREESPLDLSLPAERLHNRVRALAGWPGTHVDLVLTDVVAGTSSALQLHILRTRVVGHDDVPVSLQRNLERLKHGQASPGQAQRVHYAEGRMLLPCGGDTLLEVLEVKPRLQSPTGETRIAAKEFMQQLGKRSRLLIP